MIIDDVLVDTGSASTILAADTVAAVGIMPQLNDILSLIRGVGGVETVIDLDHLTIEFTRLS